MPDISPQLICVFQEYVVLLIENCPPWADRKIL